MELKNFKNKKMYGLSVGKNKKEIKEMSDNGDETEGDDDEIEEMNDDYF